MTTKTKGKATHPGSGVSASAPPKTQGAPPLPPPSETPNPQRLSETQVAAAKADQQAASSSPLPSEPPRRKRGRPPKSATLQQTAANEEEERKKGIAKFVGLLHFSDAVFKSVGAPGVEINSPISSVWAESAYEVEQKYGELPYLTEIVFLGCSAALFGPNLGAVWLAYRERSERRAIEATAKQEAGAKAKEVAVREAKAREAQKNGQNP